MGAGTSVQEPARPGPPDSPGEEEKKSQQEAGDQHPAGGAGDKSVQKNGQISGIQGDAEDPKALDSKSEQLNGIQEEVVAREVGQGDPAVVSGGEETEEMELNEKEVPVENEGGEQKDAQEGDELPTETGEPAEEVQAAEIGFKKVFKFVGLKFTMKKEKPVKSEPVQLLTVTREEGGVAGEVASESKQDVEGSIEANASPTDEAEGSPPEILSPEKAEECTEEEETKMLDTEEVPAAAESGANAAESPAVESPLKRFFRQGFFLGLRRKQSFKKAKDEPLVIGEKMETNGERAGDAGSEVTERGPEAQPSTSQEAAEVLTVQSPEEHGGEEEDFEDLTAELADVMVASEAPTVAESRTPEVKENGAPAEQSLVATDLGMGQQIPSTGKSPEGQAGVESPAPEASAELQAEHEEGAQEQPSVTNSEPVSDEGEFVASQRPKQQDSPLKKLFTSSSIKKLSAKKAKGKREETRAGDVDDEAKLQSSTESEGSPDSNKPDSPLAFPEEVGEGILAEVTESGSLPAAEQEEANGAGDGERKKEPITAWASFKKLVTPRKRPKGPPESERDDEPTDKAKSATLSSAESTASEKQEEPKSNGEEVKLERSTEDPKKKADAPVTWEALICVGSSKKRMRKVSDSELQKSNEEAQGSEANGQVQEHAEEAKVGSPQGPDLEQGGTSPECAESPVEGEASDGVISTWESFKRLVTPRRKSRSKLEERGEEFVPSPEAALPEAEPAKEESWVSLKKLIPGRRKKRSDIKPEQLQAESAGKDVAWAEITGSKSEEESSETPAVVPLSEYDAVDNEREHEQRLKAGTDAVQVADGVLAASEAPQPGGLGVGQTSAGERGPLEALKSSVDERSPSWISAAVSDVIEEEVEDKTGLAEETVAVQKQEVLVGEPTPEEGVRDLSPDEVAEEAQEVVPKVVATSDYPAEESFTEETTEMVSAVSQLTETPVTTAEGTPVREDEALVSRQTREVLEEAAQKVKLSVDPIVSCCQMGAPPGTQGDGPGPDISAGKSPSEGVHGSSETQAAEPARKAAEKISEAMIVGPPVGGDVLAGPSEATEQETRAEMQEVTLVQGIASAAVEQELKPVAAPEGDRQPLPLAECQGVDESMTATTVSKDGALLVEEVSPEKVEIVREQTLEAEETEVVREQSVKIAEEGDREELRATVPVTVKVGAEQIAECRKTEVVLAHAAGKDEAVLERVGATISEVAQQVGVERVEAAAVEDTEDVPEVGAEKALTERTEDAGVPEILVEQSVETPVKVEQSVTEAVSIEETGQISPPAGVSQVETSEEHVEVTPAVSVTEVLPGEGAVKTIAVELTKVESCVEPGGITSAVGVTEVVCGEEITQITPVGITEVVLGEEPIEIIPVVGVTEAVCSKETTEITPVGVTEAVLGEEPIEISPKVDVTEVMCRGIGEISPGEATEMVRSEETTELAPVGVTEAVLRQEPTEITPAAGVTGAICSEETTELTPVRVAEALLGKDPIEIIPAAGVTETLVGEETIELTPVGVTEALLGEEPIEIPVGVTEVVCSEETTEITPVGVTEAVLGEEPIEITLAVEVTEVTCRGIEIAPEGATAAVCGEKTTEITPVEVTEIISGEQPAGRSPLGVTEVVPGKEPIDVAPTVGVTEVVCGKETTEITPAVVLESLPSEEPMRITPTVGMTEAVCGEETTELAPLGVTKVIPSEEAFGITHVTVTKVLSEETVKVSSVDLSEALPGEEQIAVTPVGVTEVCGEDSIEVAAVVHSEVADAASAEAGVEESKSEREGEASWQGANEEDVQKVMDSEAAQEQLTPVEIVQQDMGAEIVETAMDEAVCEELVESPEGQRTQEALADSLGLATQILQSTTTEGPSKETNETTTTKVAGTEVKSETVCDELEGMKSVQPAAEETDTTLATVSRDQGEISPGEHPEKSLTEAAETQAGEASAAKQVETGATCVTSELLSTTSEGTTLEQTLDVVEPAEEVECKLASEERDKPAPDESIEKISLKAGELGRGDQPAVTSQVQSVSVPKPCQHIEGAAELQSDVELKSSSSDSLVKEQPLALSDPQTPVGFSKEKCEVDAETICPTLESAPEVKLHVASVDEFQVLQNEMVILMEDLPVVKSSESCEEAFLVTVSSVEEKVIAETVTTVLAEIPEPSAVDQVLPPCEDVKQVSIVETAAVIVETAIEVATGCMFSTPDDSEMVLTTDVQEAESCRKERLEDQLAECKIKETVTQKLECLETQTEVEVSQTQTFEQQSAQAAQVLSQDPLVLTQLQGQESTKEEEKLLRLQKDTAIEGTSEVVDQRFQTSGNQDFEGKERVLMQSAEMVLETTVRGGQESIETETLASMHTELGRESSDNTSGNISISSEVTRAECCQSLEQPEATRPSIELTKQTQIVTIQQIGEEQSSLHDAQGGMISLTGELANENEVETVQLNREAMDQSQSVGTDEKQSHEVETEPSVELAKGAAERTPS